MLLIGWKADLAAFIIGCCTAGVVGYLAPGRGIEFALFFSLLCAALDGAFFGAGGGAIGGAAAGRKGDDAIEGALARRAFAPRGGFMSDAPPGMTTLVLACGRTRGGIVVQEGESVCARSEAGCPPNKNGASMTAYRYPGGERRCCFRNF
jgi:hypothetical protein